MKILDMASVEQTEQNVKVHFGFFVCAETFGEKPYHCNFVICNCGLLRQQMSEKMAKIGIL